MVIFYRMGEKSYEDCRKAITDHIYHTVSVTIAKPQQRTGHFYKVHIRDIPPSAETAFLRGQERRIRRVCFFSARLPPTQAQHRHTAVFP